MCYSACCVRRDSTLGHLSLEQKTDLHEIETSFFKRKTKEKKNAYRHWQHQGKLRCVYKRLRKDAKDFSRSPGLCRHQYSEPSSEPPKLFSDKPWEIQHTQTRKAGLERSPNGDSESLFLIFSHFKSSWNAVIFPHDTLERGVGVVFNE